MSKLDVSEVESIVRIQNDLHGRISRAYENLKKSGAAKITHGVVEARLLALESNWTKFEEYHAKLLSTKPEVLAESEYVKQGVPSLAEEAYLQQKGVFLDYMRALKAQEKPAASASAPTAPSAPRTTLPRIQLPSFSGRYEDWPSFRDLFSSIIGKDATTTKVEKLHYLKSCLKNEAESLIRNLPTTDENYERAWKTLTDYYENKRLLVRAYLSTFVALTKMKSESASELRKIFHSLKSTVNALESIDRPITSSEDLWVYLAVELLDPRLRREWESVLSETTDPPSYKDLELFLERRLHALESMAPVKGTGAPTVTGNGSSKTRAHLARRQEEKAEAKRNRCSLCQGNHFVMLCEEYKSKSARDRKQHVVASSLCLNCLGRHRVSECTSKKTCSACGERHHSSLHDACRESEVAKPIEIKSSHFSRNPPVAVLLATARVRVYDRHGIWHSARALIDQGSESSLISERLAQRLRLTRSPAATAVFGVGGTKTCVARGRVTMAVSPRLGGTALSVSALILPQLTIYAGGIAAGARSWPHLQGIELADPEFYTKDTIDMLLGADIYAVILRDGLRKGAVQEPVAQNTSLGWILSGVTGEAVSNHHVLSHQCRLDEDLSQAVRRFWDQEETPASRATSQEDEECENHFARTHSRQDDGRYVVRLPLAGPLPPLAGTRRSAESVLRSMEAKFKQNAKFQALYTDFMHQYAELGHMTRVLPGADAAPHQVCFLPHHGVMRKASASTQLRVVFNGSSTLPDGESLNRHLRVGPNLLPALADILLQWRQHRFVLAADIEKMYRQIGLHPQDQSLQRILWRESPATEIKEFQLTTVTYGLACAPYLAIRTIQQLAEDEEANYPLGAAVLRREIYVDDILTGAPSLAEAKEVQRQLVQICRAGGFPLKKWSANVASLLDEVPLNDRQQQGTRWWRPGESHSTLGLRWHPHDDSFSFAALEIPAGTITKRSVLSTTARLFDPLGWLAPSTIRAKIFIQSTWLLGIDWDSPLPAGEAQRWAEYVAELHFLEEIRIPRWLTGEANHTLQEIHGFADASERAYAAVAYLRTEDRQGSVEVRIISAKTKVAPIKQVTLPRLELCAAALLVRLVAHARTTLGATNTPLHLWSDSTVALGWIRRHPASWKTYVANRVSEIQTTLPNAYWHHLPGRDNPADCASRGVSPRELAHHPLWWQGPPWLRSESAPWGSACDSISTGELPEFRTRSHAVAGAQETDEEPDVLSRYSELQRLIRITAWCRRWLNRGRETQSRDPATTLVLSAEELAAARLCWIQVTQSGNYKCELEAVRRGATLPARCALTRLNPFLDDHGLLRVGGRLKHANLSADQRHPVILPGESRFTQMVIQAAHRRTLHGGVQLTLAAVRQEFWIPRGRQLVKQCLRRCVTCLRWRAASPQPPMGNLPAARVTPSRPFLHTGIDYAGPIWLRTSKGRGHRASKAFIVVFVCLCFRAVHLDVVSDYTADAFLAALRRFVARRGLCHTIYSDCGTNFVGADAQLRALFSASSQEGQRIAARVADDRMRWRFNPPAAPNFGGIWEAAVKSMKLHLRRVLGDTTLTYEEMATLLAQIEACLNSRPLQAMSDDPEDLAALTPGHFLVGSELNAVPEPSLRNEPVNRLARWQLLQRMRDHFWERWRKEYLVTLAHRPKWFKACEDIRVGRLCLVRNESTPPNRWPLARVVRLNPGEDGHIRVVEVRTATSELTRPVTKLILLPTTATHEDGTNGAEAADQARCAGAHC